MYTDENGKERESILEDDELNLSFENKRKRNIKRSYTTSVNKLSYCKKFSKTNILNKHYNHSEYIRDIVNCFDILNQNVELTDYTLRIMGLTCFFYDSNLVNTEYVEGYCMSLPWEKEFYVELTHQKIYTKSNLPKNLKKFQKNCEERNIFISEINYKITIQEYAPKVFHHIRKIDKIDIKSILKSIDPIKNIDHISQISDIIVNGGNSGNLVIYTYDKKYLIKTISKEEKQTFIDFLPQYHKRMRDYKTLLCRIYGLFCIQIQDKDPSYIIIMRNMVELSQEVIILYIIY